MKHGTAGWRIENHDPPAVVLDEEGTEVEAEAGEARLLLENPALQVFEKKAKAAD